MSYSFVGAVGIFLAYLVPVYTLAGFYSAENVAIEIGTSNIITHYIQLRPHQYVQLTVINCYATVMRPLRYITKLQRY